MEGGGGGGYMEGGRGYMEEEGRRRRVEEEGGGGYMEGTQGGGGVEKRKRAQDIIHGLGSSQLMLVTAAYRQLKHEAGVPVRKVGGAFQLALQQRLSLVDAVLGKK